MTELHSNGNYEAYLTHLFNPMTTGTQYNPALLNTIGSAGIGGGSGIGTIPNLAGLQQNPWAAQNFQQSNALSQQGQNPAQSLPAIQLAQQIAARQAVQAIQYAQALQALQQQVLQQQVMQQLALNLAAQQSMQSAMNPQAQFGQGWAQGLSNVFGTGQTGQGFPQLQGLGTQNLINQALQQLAQNIAAQQAAQFRYGLAA